MLELVMTALNSLTKYINKSQVGVHNSLDAVLHVNQHASSFWQYQKLVKTSGSFNMH